MTVSVPLHGNDILPERLRAHIEFMKTLKAQEQGDSDEGC